MVAQGSRDGHAALVVGASGGIGNALVERLLQREDMVRVYAASRGDRPARWQGEPRLQWLQCDYSERGIADAVSGIAETPGLRHVVLCNGILHDEGIQPEKALEHVAAPAMLGVLEANTVVPMLWLGALMPCLRRSPAVTIAALSARVGSISDNRRGGWYSYRASKAALNMCLRSAAIELARRAPGARVIAFHPGTTDTALSRPFQRSVPQGKLFAPGFVAQRLLALMDDAPATGDLCFLDWAGEAITW